MLYGFDFSFSPRVRRGAHLPGETTRRRPRAASGPMSISQQRRGSRRGRFWRQQPAGISTSVADGAKADFLHRRHLRARLQRARRWQGFYLYDAIGAAQVAKASFSGMRLLHGLHGPRSRVAVGSPPERGSVVVELYTRALHPHGRPQRPQGANPRAAQPGPCGAGQQTRPAEAPSPPITRPTSLIAAAGLRAIADRPPATGPPLASRPRSPAPKAGPSACDDALGARAPD